MRRPLALLVLTSLFACSDSSGHGTEDRGGTGDSDQVTDQAGGGDDGGDDGNGDGMGGDADSTGGDPHGGDSNGDSPPPGDDDAGSDRDQGDGDQDPAANDNLFTVDSADDEEDADTNDGQCQSVNGKCTLRAAIEQGNAAYAVVRIGFAEPVRSLSFDTPLPAFTRDSLTLDASNLANQDGTPGLTINGWDLYDEINSVLPESFFLVSETGALRIVGIRFEFFHGGAVHNASSRPTTIERSVFDGGCGAALWTHGDTTLTGSDTVPVVVTRYGRIDGCPQEQPHAGVVLEINTGTPRAALNHVTIQDNAGPGLVTTAGTDLNNVSILDNAGHGIVHQAGGSGETMHFGLAQASRIANNDGFGVFVDHGDLNLQSEVVIEDNGGAGVFVDLGSVVAGDTFRGANVTIRRNGGPTRDGTCTHTEVSDGDLEESTIPCPGGGIYVFSTRSSDPNFIDSSTIDSNFGPGILSNHPVRLSRVDLIDNFAQGVVVIEDSEAGPASAKTIDVELGPVEISGNGIGLEAEWGNVEVSASGRFERNRAMAVLAHEGNVDFTRGEQAKLVANTQFAGTCWRFGADFDIDDGDDNVVYVEWITQDLCDLNLYGVFGAIDARSGSVTLEGTEVRENRCVGVKAADQVLFLSGQSCDNDAAFYGDRVVGNVNELAGATTERGDPCTGFQVREAFFGDTPGFGMVHAMAATDPNNIVLARGSGGVVEAGVDAAAFTYPAFAGSPTFYDANVVGGVVYLAGDALWQQEVDGWSAFAFPIGGSPVTEMDGALVVGQHRFDGEGWQAGATPMTWPGIQSAGSQTYAMTAPGELRVFDPAGCDFYDWPGCWNFGPWKPNAATSVYDFELTGSNALLVATSAGLYSNDGTTEGWTLLSPGAITRLLVIGDDRVLVYGANGVELYDGGDSRQPIPGLEGGSAVDPFLADWIYFPAERSVIAGYKHGFAEYRLPPE